MAYIFSQARALVARELETQSALVCAGDTQPLNIPVLLGPVGGGKTALSRLMAEHYEIFLAAINSGENSDATDLSGVPVPNLVRTGEHTSYMEWVLNQYAAMACDQPVFLLFDDLDKAPPPVQSAMLGIMGNRMFRNHRIHPGTLIMGAGNRIGDDVYANEISESVRTRATIIEMVPDVVSFSEWGVSSGEIHSSILGYLQYRPEHLYKWQDGVNRFPTPRGWREVTQHFTRYPDAFDDVFHNGAKDNWRGIVSRKCGDHIGSDFWGWFEVISKVDVAKILTTGDSGISPATGDARMLEFAAIYAVAQELNHNGVKSTYSGIIKFSNDLAPEMRVAFVVQLSRKVRGDIATHFPAAADVMLSAIVPTADGRFKLTPAKTNGVTTA